MGHRIFPPIFQLLDKAGRLMGRLHESRGPRRAIKIFGRNAVIFHSSTRPEAGSFSWLQQTENVLRQLVGLRGQCGAWLPHHRLAR